MINMIFLNVFNINIVCCFSNFILIYDKKKNKNKKSIIFLKQIVMTMYKLVTMIRVTNHLLTWMHDTKKYSSTLNCPVNICFHWISFVTHVSEILKGRLNRDVFWISARPILSVYFLEMGEKRKIRYTEQN